MNWFRRLFGVGAKKLAEQKVASARVINEVLAAVRSGQQVSDDDFDRACAAGATLRGAHPQWSSAYPSQLSSRPLPQTSGAPG